MKKRENELCINKVPYDEYKKISIYEQEPYKGLIKKYTNKIYPVVVTIDDILDKLPYETSLKYFRTNLHLGQRKLFLTELQFLTKYLETKDDECYVVYAGAAPSGHIYFLHLLFPNIKFILVDPNSFVLNITDPKHTHYKIQTNEIVYMSKSKKTPNNNNFIVYDGNMNIIEYIRTTNYHFYLFEEFYTNDTSKLLIKLNDRPIYFWSDIRTDPNDLHILWNLAQQHNWIKYLKPKAFMLKFRCPYFINKLSKDEIMDYINRNFDDSISHAKKWGLNIIDDYLNKKLVYFKGTINVQAFGPPSTTEVRLVSNNYLTYTDYKCLDAEEKFFFHNNIDRTFIRHDNKYSDQNLGFDHCNDCSLEAYLWSNYIKKFDATLDVQYCVTRLCNLLGNNLKKNGHGFLFEKYTEEWYKGLYNKYCYDMKHSEKKYVPPFSIKQERNEPFESVRKIEIIPYNEKLITFAFPDTPNKKQLMMTNVGVYSVSGKEGAEFIVNIIKSNCDKKHISVTDGTANNGSDTITLGLNFDKVSSIEIDKTNYEVLENNVKVFGLENKVKTYHGNTLQIIKDLTQDVIYLDPPWGGKSYKDQKIMRLYLDDMELSDFYLAFKNKAKLFVFKVPRNYDFNNFIFKTQSKINIYPYIDSKHNKLRFYVMVIQ